jgi:hypothetical protein
VLDNEPDEVVRLRAIVKDLVARIEVSSVVRQVLNSNEFAEAKEAAK